MGGILQFGEFQVDPSARSLRRHDELITLNRRAFDLLLYLLQNPGRVLSHDELLKNIWPDTSVDENNLAQCISMLRRALDEKRGDNSYIATLPGRGYQFVSAVKVVAPAAIPKEPGQLFVQQTTIQTRVTIEDAEPISLPASPGRSRLTLAAILAACAVLSACIYGWKQIHRVQPPAPGTGVALAPRRSIAVIGFRNLSGRPDEAWLSTALAEMLSTELVAGEKLRLVSGEDIARTKRELPLDDADSLSRDTLARLRKNLDSDLIVLGSYTALGEKAGSRIRFDLRLQDTTAGETVADVAVTGSEADLFDMVSQAGAELRQKLGVDVVSPVEAVSVRASLPSNREAARLYSEGLARLHALDALTARDRLQQAIAADAKFSLAHSALAGAWARLGYDQKAQHEARQAYDLAVNLSREDKLVVEGRYLEIDHQYDKAIGVYGALFTLFPDNLDYGLKLAAEQTSASKGHDALATVDSLRKRPPPGSEDPRIDLQEAAAWDSLSDFKRQQQPLARAVEKAKAQGARLILAEGLQNQCWVFSYLGQVQDAIAACRESRDIFAAAGDEQNEARSLRVWADAISETDAPEAIRLYQLAETTFRRVGSESGLAGVLNNLGRVYDQQGDPATAEKMQRQALAISRLLDNKRQQATMMSNIANVRSEQGDLRGALQLFEESARIDPEDAGHGTNAEYNIADIHRVQGDLAGAREGFERSLATWQKSGDQDASAYALSSLGSLLLQQADFSGARKSYEQALAIRTQAGEQLSAAQIQLGLAEVSLEAGHAPLEQEAAIRQAIEVFQKQKSRDDEIHAWCDLTRALLTEGKPASAAAAAVQSARSLAARSQNPEVRWQAALAAARIQKDEKASAHATSTKNELAAIVTQSRTMGYAGIELEARLVLAENEMQAGQTGTGRAHLTTIAADAEAKGYHLLAHKALLARG